MSGVVAVLGLHGAPVDGMTLDRLTACLDYRGPDGRDSWRQGPIGFGHTLLRTATGFGEARQPCSLDGETWIVADARIDGRRALRRALMGAGLRVPERLSDGEWILHAYRAWGDDCVMHLIGDFAFALWDGRRRRLLCARDHFGVKPFFYARTGDYLVLGNTLGVVRRFPGLGDAPNDEAIADFLVSGVYQDPGATAFADVHRLPPAHRLVVSGGALRVERYWQLPAGGRLCYRDPADYVADFSEHLATAVADRLADHRVGVLMSGGLDSTSVAAVAKTQLAERYDNYDLRAYTCVYDRLFQDEERNFARTAARALGIPIRYLAADDYPLFGRWRAFDFPEPADEPLAAVYVDQARQMAGQCRVALTGWDGDALFGEQRKRAGRGLYTLYKGVRSGCRRIAGYLTPSSITLSKRDNFINLRYKSTLPGWLGSAVADRLAEAGGVAGGPRDSGVHGSGHLRARRCLTSPLLTSLLESYDPGLIRVPVETRHPLLDVRLVGFVLSLPESPWCVGKTLLREAMRGRLPEAVRTRPKTPLAGDPVIEILRGGGADWVDGFEAAPTFERFVVRSAVPGLSGAGNPDEIWTNLRPLCLNLWLESLQGSRREYGDEEYHEVA